MNPQTESLKEYIKTCLQNELGKDTIRDTLLQSNWPEQAINDAFSAIDAEDQMIKQVDDLGGPNLVVPIEQFTFRRKIIILAATIIIVGGGLFLGLMLLNRDGKDSNLQQSAAAYKPMPTPDGWMNSTLNFDGKQFSFAMPSSWNVKNRYDEPSGTYSDMRIVTSDYEDVAALKDYENKGIVSKGAVIDIAVTHFTGTLESYKKSIEDGTAADVALIVSGYRDLKQTSINGRPAVTYLKNTNFVRTIVILDGPYLVKFSYFQPYDTPSLDQKPELKDTHLKDVQSVVASFNQS